MKSDPNASSSKHATARDISHRLAGGQQPSGPRVPSFVSFRSIATGLSVPPPAAVSPSVSAQGRASAYPPALPLPPLPDDLGSGARRWETLLKWALTAAGCDAAFLMGPDGFLVASAGEIPLPDIEAIGARMMAALDYVRPIAQPGGLTPSLTLTFDELHLTAFEVRMPDGTALTLCLGGQKPVPRSLCALLENRLVEALPAPE